MIGRGLCIRRIKAREQVVNPGARLGEANAQAVALCLKLPYALLKQGIGALELGMAKGQTIDLVGKIVELGG